MRLASLIMKAIECYTVMCTARATNHYLLQSIDDLVVDIVSKLA
jgi:hypothetical protein